MVVVCGVRDVSRILFIILSLYIYIFSADLSLIST